MQDDIESQDGKSGRCLAGIATDVVYGDRRFCNVRDAFGAMVWSGYAESFHDAISQAVDAAQ